ncbi:MAG: pyridoxamine 5'-phosphate oxidase family protein [Lachnospiraceae bacterium]|nr:pyridoxamine 5'-phosphate oxidase family protein [Lachnospiraceae bacterium]
MDVFTEKYEEFLLEFTKGKTMVLSSSKDNKVTSRMMSVVLIDGLFYFQTDKTFRKYDQLISNPQVALCADNIQIEGVCEEIGHPMDNDWFCTVYKDCFEGSFNRYSFLKNETVFVVKPTYVERWMYVDGEPFIEIFNIEKQEYELTEYEGI